MKKHSRRSRVRARVRKKVSGTPWRPRLAVFRSNKQVYAQIIDDIDGSTLVAYDSRSIEQGDLTKVQVAEKVGEEIGKKAIDAGISEVVFDRGGYLYHGRVRALADGARKAGLKF